MKKILFVLMMISPVVLQAQQGLIGQDSTYITQRPVLQQHNRYNWMARHEAVKQRIKDTDPPSIIFANSIIHLWGGEPKMDTFTRNGPQSWATYMEPTKVQNAGFGSDLIQNVLWRVQNGELDHFHGKKIIVMIGTNNVMRNNDDEIIAGLTTLLQEIHARKPEAELTMVGILPRIKREERVRLLNEKIRQMVDANKYRFVDFSAHFLKDGRLIEYLFPDGLHPNEAGYMILGKQLQQIL